MALSSIREHQSCSSAQLLLPQNGAAPPSAGHMVVVIPQTGGPCLAMG